MTRSRVITTKEHRYSVPCKVPSKSGSTGPLRSIRSRVLVVLGKDGEQRSEAATRTFHGRRFGVTSQRIEDRVAWRVRKLPREEHTSHNNEQAHRCLSGSRIVVHGSLLPRVMVEARSRVCKSSWLRLPCQRKLSIWLRQLVVHSVRACSPSVHQRAVLSACSPYRPISSQPLKERSL